MLKKIRRFALLIMVAALLMGCLSGCVTLDLSKLNGIVGSGSDKDENNAVNGPLFDPDGEDDPVTNQGGETQSSNQSTEGSQQATRPSKDETEPTGEDTKPTDPEPTQESTEATKPDETEPAEDDPLPANPIGYGVVLGDVVNVRSGPGTDYDIVDRAVKYDRLAIYQRKNGWGRLKTGWISLQYVYVDGEVGPNGSVMGVVDGTDVRIRSGPGTKYGVNVVTKDGERLEILFRAKFGNTQWGCTKRGWICMDYVYVDGEVGPDGSVKGTVQGTDVRIRSGPGTNYAIKTVVHTGERLEILYRAKFGDMEWGCTKQGWICMDYVKLDK